MAAAASDRGDDLAAVRQLRELAGLLKPVSDDPAERRWYLLALNRIESLENAARDRRTFVKLQLQLAEEASRSGRHDEATAIRNKLAEQFGKFTDLADLLAPPHPTPPPSSRSAPP